MPTVLVTGASRGIGLAIARRMQSAGWDVLSGVRREEDATVGTPVIVDMTDTSAFDTAIWQGAETTLDDSLAALKPEHRELYGKRVEAMRRTVRLMARSAIPPGKAAEAAHHALTAKRPKARYLVGIDARANVALHALPERAFDAAIARLTGGR